MVYTMAKDAYSLVLLSFLFYSLLSFEYQIAPFEYLGGKDGYLYVH